MNKIFLTQLKLAYQSLSKNKTRAFLTILAISIGISAVIVVFSAGYGLKSMVSSELKSFGTDILEIEIKTPNSNKTSVNNASSFAQGLKITTLKNSNLKVIAQHPNISYIYGGIIDQQIVSYKSEIKKVFLFGTGYQLPYVDNFDILYGRFYTQTEEETLSQVVVLGYDIWQDFFGNKNPIGKYIKIANKKFRVIGVAEKRGSVFFMNLDEQIYIPLKTLQKKIMGIDYVNFAMMKLKDSSLEKSQKTQQEVSEILRRLHKINDPQKDDFVVTTMDEALNMFDKIINSITALLIVLVMISLLVGGVGIMNIMYVSVTERTFEIGLRKSFGAKNKDILWQFLLEAVLITSAGSLVGIISGIVFSYLIYLLAIHYQINWVFKISFLSIFIASFFSVFIGLLFGIYPAKKASDLDPIKAIRRL